MTPSDPFYNLRDIAREVNYHRDALRLNLKARNAEIARLNDLGYTYNDMMPIVNISTKQEMSRLAKRGRTGT